jgi:hypothetical protein
MEMVMKKVGLTMVALMGLASSANAQGVAEPRATLNAEIGSQLASGQSPPINAAQLRTVLYDMVASTSAIFQDAVVTLTGGMVIGSATGGSQGAGTINVSGNYYVNGTPVSGGGGTVNNLLQKCGGSLTPNPITTSGNIGADVAVAGDIWATTTCKMIDAAGAAASIAFQTLTISVSTFTPAYGSGINLKMTLVHAACPCTVANPTGAYNGLSGILEIDQSATGGDTVVWGGNWHAQNGTFPTLTATASAIDLLPFVCRSNSYCVITGIVGNVQ